MYILPVSLISNYLPLAVWNNKETDYPCKQGHSITVLGTRRNLQQGPCSHELCAALCGVCIKILWNLFADEAQMCWGCLHVADVDAQDAKRAAYSWSPPQPNALKFAGKQEYLTPFINRNFPVYCLKATFHCFAWRNEEWMKEGMSNNTSILYKDKFLLLKLINLH